MNDRITRRFSGATHSLYLFVAASTGLALAGCSPPTARETVIVPAAAEDGHWIIWRAPGGATGFQFGTRSYTVTTDGVIKPLDYCGAGSDEEPGGSGLDITVAAWQGELPSAALSGYLPSDAVYQTISTVPDGAYDADFGMPVDFVAIQMQSGSRQTCIAAQRLHSSEFGQIPPNTYFWYGAQYGPPCDWTVNYACSPQGSDFKAVPLFAPILGPPSE